MLCIKRSKILALGFTLIELMITVAIMAILASVAYSTYTEQINRGRRSEAKAIAQEAVQWMERFYAENYSYEKNTKNVAVADLFSVRFSQAPRPPASAAYTIELKNLSAFAYSLVMKRAGQMTGDKCGDFVLKHTGDKTAENFSTTAYTDAAAALATCWR
jgi:type IV pilus assembly protein PilE